MCDVLRVLLLSEVLFVMTASVRVYRDVFVCDCNGNKTGWRRETVRVEYSVSEERGAYKSSRGEYCEGGR